MADVNEMIIQELSFDDIKAHFNEHHKKYSAALAAAFAAYAGHQGYKAYKTHKHKKDAVHHLKNNREIYAGAGTGALASLISSHGKPIGNRLKNAAVSAMGGALGGSILKNAREHSEFNLRSKK